MSSSPFQINSSLSLFAFINKILTLQVCDVMLFIPSWLHQLQGWIHILFCSHPLPYLILVLCNSNCSDCIKSRFIARNNEPNFFLNKSKLQRREAGTPPRVSVSFSNLVSYWNTIQWMLCYMTITYHPQTRGKTMYNGVDGHT